VPGSEPSCRDSTEEESFCLRRTSCCAESIEHYDCSVLKGASLNAKKLYFNIYLFANIVELFYPIRILAHEYNFMPRRLIHESASSAKIKSSFMVLDCHDIWFSHSYPPRDEV